MQQSNLVLKSRATAQGGTRVCRVAMDAAIGRVLSRSGGSSQRLQHRQSIAESSVLAERLQEAWGWGLLSAPLVQWLAEGGRQDGANGLGGLAGLGSHGRHEGNCHRDLVRLLRPQHQTPPPTLVQTQLNQVKDDSVVEGEWPVLMPSHLIHFFATHMPEKLQNLLEDAARFWAGLQDDDPKLVGNPCKDWGDGWQARTIPLALHGDAGTYTKSGESVVVLSWGSLLHRAETWDSIYLIFAIPKSACVKQEGINTLDTLFEAVAADLRTLMQGHAPEQAPDKAETPHQEVLFSFRCRLGHTREF